MIESSAIAHPNVALVKYWGKKHDALNIPSTPSLSITLGALKTETSIVEHHTDEIWINDQRIVDQKITNWLEKVRDKHPIPPVLIRSHSDFPANSGLASSASGFAALAKATSMAFDLPWDQQTLAIWARLGSASAARSITGGWSTLVPCRDSEGGHVCKANQLYDSSYWDIRVVIGITSTVPKRTSSTQGMLRSQKSSPYYENWVKSTRKDFEDALLSLKNKDLTDLGQISESSSRKMHALMLSTEPPLRYWNEVTLTCLDAVEQLRAHGVEAYYSIDAGSQVKIICHAEDAAVVYSAISRVEGMKSVLQSSVGGGVH